MDIAGEMRAAIGDFLGALTEEQRARVTLPFTDEEARRDWTYLPGERAGVAWAELHRDANVAARRLIASTLSVHAQAQLAAIAGLEDVLDRTQGYRRDRHVGDYWTVVFGDPDGDGPVTWRVAGHHVTVNATLVDREVRATPLFLGANPARLEQGGQVVSRPLPREELLAYELVDSLSTAERDTATLGSRVPDDILSSDEPRVPDALRPEGLALGDAHAQVRTLARQLLEVYLARIRPELRGSYAHVLEEGALGATHLAWCGQPADGRPHYYRLHGPTVLIELDDVQDGANHVHTVWRDPRTDFGEDLLDAHHRVPGQ